MNTDIDLEEICCPTCMVLFYITKSHADRLKTCHNTFHCPNGHEQSYLGKTEEELLRDRLRDKNLKLQLVQEELEKLKKKKAPRRKSPKK